MKVHIVGAGPTGLSLAWELLRTGDHEVTIYDKKTSAGGSWWEPEIGTRDLHAHRILFDNAFVNFQSLLGEMGIEWHDMFTQVNKMDYMKFMLENLSPVDYMTFIFLATKVYTEPETYKRVSLKDAIGVLSKNGQKYVEHLPLVMDGVTWDVMSAYEFVKVLII